MDTTGNKKAANLSLKTIRGSRSPDSVTILFMPKSEIQHDRIAITAMDGPFGFTFTMLPDQAHYMAECLRDMAEAIKAIQAAECAPAA